MSGDDGHGGESGRLAPVTPIGDARPAPASARASRPSGSRRGTVRFVPEPVSSQASDSAPRTAFPAGSGRRSTASGGRTRGDRASTDPATTDLTTRDRSRGDSGEPAPTSREDVVAAAEAVLLRRLRSRARSVSEARSLIAPGLTGEEARDLLERFERLGYLDDAALAEQLVRTGSERKGQGRRAVAQTLAARGVPGAVADAALASLADDDEDRALDFARGRMRTVGVGRDAAIRRVAGQLARRGYPGHVALSAARRAWDEAATD